MTNQDSLFDAYDNHNRPPSSQRYCADDCDAMHPPIRALLQALDVQLAEQEALVVCGVARRLRHRRAALSRSRSGPSRCHVSRFSGSRPSPRFRPVPSSRPIGTGRLLWKSIRKTGDFTAGLRADTGNVKSWQNFSNELFIVFFFFKPMEDWTFYSML